MNYTDDQLKQLLEKMTGRKCKPEGELHLCSLVETGLTENQKCQYVVRLSTTDRENSHDWNMAFATWQQRTTALAEVKGDK